MLKKVLITGANGMLAKELRDVLNVENGISFEVTFKTKEELDITKLPVLESFFSENKYDYIVNCAAYTDVNGADNDPDGAYIVNGIGVKNLAKISDKYNIKLIHISTDYVHDNSQNTPISPNPRLILPQINEYGRSKYEGEKYIAEYAPYNSLIIRTSWLYSINYGNNAIMKMIDNMSKNNVVKYAIDQTSSLTNAHDLSLFIMKVIKSRRWENGTFNYCNLGSCTWFDVANAVRRIRDLDVQIKTCYSIEFDGAMRPSYSVLDCTDTIETFDIEIPHWYDSLKKTLNP